MSASRPLTYDRSARGPDPGGGRRSGGRALLAAVLSLLAIAVAAPGASAQQPDTWPCDSFGYLFQYYGSQTDNAIVQVDLATGTQTAIAEPPGPLNAAGYNQLDGYYYAWMRAVEATNTWTMVRVHPDGSVDDLGNPLPVTTGSAYGDVDPNGHYWFVADNLAGNNTWYEVDLVPGSPTYGQVLDFGPANPPAGAGNIGADWTWIDGALYSVSGETAGPHDLLRFNPATGTFANLGTLPAPFPSGTDGNIGATFADASGYLYASANATNTVWRIDTTTRQVIMSAPPPPGVSSSPGNDGARCANAVVPTITVKKAVDGRVRAADQFTVSLRRPDGSLATSATTSGSQTTASTVNVPASQGKTYTITDAMATGSPTPLGEYAKSIACTDAAGNAAPVGGSGPTWTLNVANPTFYTCTVTNGGQADLELVKTSSTSPVVPGEDVTYELTVTNHGPSTAINANVTDPLPDGVTFVSASAGCSESGGTVTCTAASLAPSASRTYTITTHAASSLDGCPRNTATVTSSIADPDTSNNSSTVCPPIEGRVDLGITKTPSRTRVPQGGQIMYTLVISNKGPSDATGVTVVDPMAEGLTLQSANPSQGSCSTAGNQVNCDMGKLVKGGSAQVLVTAQVGTRLGDIDNTATVTGDQTDPHPDDNHDSATITVVPGPEPRFDLEVVKTSNVAKAYVGQPVTYRIVVTNDGPEAAPDVEITDTLSAPATVVSVKTTAGSCTKRIPMRCDLGTIAAGGKVTISVKVKHRTAGCNQRNAASATGDGTDTDPADNLDVTKLCIKKVPLSIKKIASRASVPAGGTLTYTIRVRNRTKGEATNVRVCDRLPSGLRFVSSTPASKRRGSSQRCWTIKRLRSGGHATYKVTVRVLPGASGRKVNTATATGAGVAGARARSPVRVRGGGGGLTG